jgi:preprotein translocase subunit SecY
VLAVRFLDLVKPFTPLIPEIAVPETKTPFQQRLIWTGVTLLIFLVMSQMPLYGIVSSGELQTYNLAHDSNTDTAQTPLTRSTGSE